ncbi:hypothetical protein, partial [Sinorhizobium medicae]|uniref:hypothetical protein n=1 Tax=Sinorhizobium medicae TaxID=110321 RepID=UPI001AEC7DEA
GRLGVGCGSDDALEELKIPSSIPTLICENAGISGVGLKRTANSLRGKVCARIPPFVPTFLSPKS